MTHHFQPGDVALVSVDINPGPRVMYRIDDSHWMDFEQDYWDKAQSAWTITEVRPLVVIDPDDYDQIKRLADAYNAATRDNRIGTIPLEAALREFANPTPPKLDEPTGRFAEVENAEGMTYYRSPVGSWHRSSDNLIRPWDAIGAVRVVSEGVVA